MVGTVSPEAETGRKWRKVGGNHFVGVVGVLLRPQSATVMRYEGRKVVKRCVTSCFAGCFAGCFACFARCFAHVSRVSRKASHTFRARFAHVSRA